MNSLGVLPDEQQHVDEGSEVPEHDGGLEAVVQVVEPVRHRAQEHQVLLRVHDGLETRERKSYNSALLDLRCM